jgi:hypothetical protein
MISLEDNYKGLTYEVLDLQYKFGVLQLLVQPPYKLMVRGPLSCAAVIKI